jgi:hypothetical protein
VSDAATLVTCEKRVGSFFNAQGAEVSAEDAEKNGVPGNLLASVYPCFQKSAGKRQTASLPLRLRRRFCFQRHATGLDGLRIRPSSFF